MTSMISDIDLDYLMQFIHASLASPDTIDFDLFRDQAVAYNDLCFELNSKLAAAQRLIDKGLRDDAIALSQENGNLLGLFESLDFPHRELWCELIEALELPRPPDLDADAATNLNLAFATIDDLGTLLKNHRLLALGRAPLPKRIGLLNALAQRDTDNPIWAEDAANFQKARLAKLPTEIAKAIQSENLQELNAIHRELTASKWWIPVPPKLITQVKTALHANTRRDLIQELQAVGQQLVASQHEDDFRQGVALLDRIGDLMNRAELQFDDPVLQPLAAAMAWVNAGHAAESERKAKQVAVNRLTTALTQAKTADELRKKLQVSKARFADLPADIVDRTERRIHALERATRNKKLLTIGTITALILCTKLLASAFYLLRDRESKALARETALRRWIEDEEWEQAQQFYNDQTEAMRRRPAFAEAAIEINAFLKAEQTRSDEFKRIAAEVLDTTLSEPNEGGLKQLFELVRTTDEKLILTKAESTVREKRAKMLDLRESQGQAALDEFRNTLKRIQPAKIADRNALRDLSSQIQVFLNGNEVSGSHSREAQQLRTEVNQELDRISQFERWLASATLVTQTIGDQEKFAATIASFASRSQLNDSDPALPVDESLRRFHSDLSWVGLINSEVIQSSRIADADTIKEWLNELDRLSLQSPEHGFAKILRTTRPQIEATAKRADAIATLTKFSKSELFGPLYVYFDPDADVRYYSDQHPTERAEPLHVISYFADYTLARRQTNFGSARYHDKVKPLVVRAGQSEFGDKMRQLMTEELAKDFTPGAFKVLAAIKQIPEDRIDPIFKLYLLNKMLEVMMPASLPIERGFSRIATKLRQSNFPWDTNWMSLDSTSEDLLGARRQALQLLAETKDWTESQQRMKATYLELSRAVHPRLRWVGWVAESPYGWKALIHEPKANNAELAVIADLPGETRLMAIGNDTGQSMLNVNTVAAQRFATAVFAIEK